MLPSGFILAGVTSTCSVTVSITAGLTVRPQQLPSGAPAGPLRVASSTPGSGRGVAGAAVSQPAKAATVSSKAAQCRAVLGGRGCVMPVSRARLLFAGRLAGCVGLAHRNVGRAVTLRKGGWNRLQ